MTGLEPNASNGMYQALMPFQARGPSWKKTLNVPGVDITAVLKLQSPTIEENEVLSSVEQNREAANTSPAETLWK